MSRYFILEKDKHLKINQGGGGRWVDSVSDNLLILLPMALQTKRAKKQPDKYPVKHYE